MALSAAGVRPAAAVPHGPVDGPDGLLAGVAAGRGRTVAMGQDAGGRAMAWWSDGGRWTPASVPPPPDAALGDAAAVPGGFVAVGSRARQAAAWWSPDGSTWRATAPLPGPGHLAAVAASGRSVLAVGAVLDGETDEGVAPLIAALDRSGWSRLSSTGVGALDHGSLTAVAHHAGRWVVAGVTTAASSLWTTEGSAGWQARADGAAEPVAWSSLLPVGSELVAIGTTVAGGEVALSRSLDARRWRLGDVPGLLASVGSDLRSVAVDAASGQVVAGTLGAVTELAAGVLR
jgi:hypothetical protein